VFGCTPDVPDICSGFIAAARNSLNTF